MVRMVSRVTDVSVRVFQPFMATIQPLSRFLQLNRSAIVSPPQWIVAAVFDLNAKEINHHESRQHKLKIERRQREDATGKQTGRTGVDGTVQESKRQGLT